MRRALALALVCAACGNDVAPERPAPGAAPSPGPAATLDLDSVEAVQRAESLATAQDVWNAVEVVSRLEQAGLVVRDLGRPIRAAGFGVEGATYSVSGGQLHVFLYPSAAARSADTESLDSARAAPPGTASSWTGVPRLMTSGNLAAVLLADREQLAERVRNVLTARHAGGGG